MSSLLYNRGVKREQKLPSEF